MLAVAREDEVARGEGVRGAHLHGFLAAARGPQRELTLALEGHALGIQSTGEDHVAMEGAQLVRREVGDPRVEFGIRDARAVGLEHAGDVVDVAAGVGGSAVGGSVFRRGLGVRHRHPSRCGPGSS